MIISILNFSPYRFGRRPTTSLTYLHSIYIFRYRFREVSTSSVTRHREEAIIQLGILITLRQNVSAFCFQILYTATNRVNSSSVFSIYFPPQPSLEVLRWVWHRSPFAHKFAHFLILQSFSSGTFNFYQYLFTMAKRYADLPEWIMGLKCS